MAPRRPLSKSLTSIRTPTIMPKLDEDTVASCDSSSLGTRFQLPAAFQQRHQCRPSASPMMVVGVAGTRARHSSLTSGSRCLREEVNMNRLVQEARDYDIRMARSMSVKLPAYEHHQNQMTGRGSGGTGRSGGPQQIAPLPKPMFRGTKSSISSAAAGSFAEQEQYNKKRTGTGRKNSLPGGNNHDNKSSSSPSPTTTSARRRRQGRLNCISEEKKRRFSFSLPRLPSCKPSTLVHV